MSDRLPINNTIRDKSVNFYYSVTDMYDMDLFTTEFRRDAQSLEQSDRNEIQKNLHNVFIDEYTAGEGYESISKDLFINKKYESRYVDVVDRGSILLTVMLCLLSAVFSLGLCSFMKRRRKTDDDLIETRQSSDGYKSER